MVWTNRNGEEKMMWVIAKTEKPRFQTIETQVLLYDDEKKRFIFQISTDKDKLILYGKDAVFAFFALQLEEVNDLLKWLNAKGYKVIPDYTGSGKDSK